MVKRVIYKKVIFLAITGLIILVNGIIFADSSGEIYDTLDFRC